MALVSFRFVGVTAALLGCILLLSVTLSAAAQFNAQCGIVDVLDYPIDGITAGYDDFGLYRPRFEGLHTGIDIGFSRWGDPVHATARGRVTYADPEGWEMEKGVVVMQHVFPDGSIAYSVYGHMEQTDDIFFPLVGQCLERGAIVGTIGWPSRGLPHLHYEIRTVLPDEGGPGYTQTNPLLLGWYHPQDFTQLWRARLDPAFISYATFDTVASLPPVALDNGTYAITREQIVEGVTQFGDLLWRVELDSIVNGIAALPGNRVVAHSRNGQAVVVQEGRYVALWQVPGPDVPFIVLDETLIFTTNGGGIAAFDSGGQPLWSVAGALTGTRVDSFAANGSQVALAMRDGDNVNWRVVDLAGQVTYETQLARDPSITARHDGSWLLLDGSTLAYVQDGQRQALTNLDIPATRNKNIAVDAVGNSYLYLGDLENTLYAIGPQGEMRWQIAYPNPPGTLPPLVKTGSGCLVYTLDANGMLNVFDTNDGALLHQLQFYAGGDRNGNPLGRMLIIDSSERVSVASGFLTTVILDGWKLGNKQPDSCLLG